MVDGLCERSPSLLGPDSDDSEVFFAEKLPGQGDKLPGFNFANALETGFKAFWAEEELRCSQST